MRNTSPKPAGSLVIPGLVAVWLVVSLVFLVPLWQNPSLAVRNDDYWAISEWFHDLGPYTSTHFGPGFPFLIFLLRSVGVTMFGLAVVQKLLVGIAMLALFRIGVQLRLPTALAAVAALAYGLTPLVQANSSVFFAETFYFALLTWGFALLLANSTRPDQRRSPARSAPSR